MRLVHQATGKEVKVLDKVKSFRGHKYVVTGWTKPHSAESTGRIYVATRPGQPEMGYFPSVVDCEWVDREDRD